MEYKQWMKEINFLFLSLPLHNSGKYYHQSYQFLRSGQGSITDSGSTEWGVVCYKAGSKGIKFWQAGGEEKICQ